MELVALYKRVIGLDVHQAQITACALIEESDGTTRIEQRQFGGFKRDRRKLAEWVEHEEDGAQDFVADGDDGPLVAASNHERLELRLEHGRGTTGGMSELAEQAADIQIALAKATGFAFAGRLVVTGANADPGGEAIGAAKDRHVGADLDQQHGGADQIDAGNGLQQCQGVALGFEPSQQSGIEAGDAGFDILDVPHQLVEHKAVAVRQIALQGFEDFFTTGLQPAAGMPQDFAGRFAGDDRLDHGPGRQTVQITDYHAQANAAVGQHLMQTILLRGQLADEFLPLAGNQTQFPQFGWRHPRAAQQARACQRRQPVGIAHVRLSARHILHVPSIDHLGANATGLINPDLGKDF